MISFKTDWFDLLAVQGTQESSPAPQFESIDSLAFCLLYGPTVTSIHDYCPLALTIWIFIGEVMSLFFNTLSRFAIVFLPRSNCLLISWLWSPCSDFRVQEGETCHCFHLFFIYLPQSDGTGCHDLSLFCFVLFF